MTETIDLPKPLLVLIALLQGLLLLLLHEAMDRGFWPANDPAATYAAFTAVIVGPTFMLLSLDGGNLRRLLRWVVPFTVLVAALGYYTGMQQLPSDKGGASTLYFVYGLTMAIACFKALLYVQHFAGGMPLSYPQLFQFSWRNFLTQGNALLFTGLFWGILMLWGALFKLIKIDFFSDLFAEKWFLYPALGMAHGFGIVLFRSQHKIFDLATRVNQALMKFLLVMLVLVAVIFLCALPFTGLAPLWETHSGTALILWLQVLVLFFLNGVYQDDEARPYPLPLHRLVYIGVALLPIYSAIAFYGLQLRMEQYGWTLERCWAVLVWAVLALYSLGYLVGICRRRDRWAAHLGWVNIRIGLLLMIVLLATNSPLLDFRKIVVASQLARLQSGAVALQDFDYSYFRHHLARPGFDALQELKTRDADIAQKIDDLYLPFDRAGKNDAQSLGRNLLVWPAAATLPPGLLDEVARWSNNRVSLRVTQTSVFVVDLNGDGADEYLVSTHLDTLRSAALFVPAANGWQRIDVAVRGAATDAELAASMERGDVKAVAPTWRDLHVGGLRLQVN